MGAWVIPQNHCGRCQLLFVLCLGRCAVRLCGWVNSAQSLQLLPAFVCVVFGPMVQRNFVGVGDNRCNVSCFNFWPTASCIPRVRCLAQHLCIPRQRCALLMGLENEKLDGSSVVGWCGCGCQVRGWLWCCMTDLAQSWHS